MGMKVAPVIDLFTLCRDLSARYVVTGAKELPFDILEDNTPRVYDNSGEMAAMAALVACECIKDLMKRYCAADDYKADSDVASMLKTILENFDGDLRGQVRALMDRVRPRGSYLSEIREDRDDTYELQVKYFAAQLRRAADGVGFGVAHELTVTRCTKLYITTPPWCQNLTGKNGGSFFDKSTIFSKKAISYSPVI